MNKRVVGLSVLGLAGLVGSSALAAAPAAYQRPGANSLISVSSTGEQSNYSLAASTVGGSQYWNCGGGSGDISPNGRWVTFATEASNLAPGDVNQSCDVFWRDTRTGTTKAASTSSYGTFGVGGPSQRPVISADGRYVAFTSSATGLVLGDTNLARDVFRHDTRTGQTIRVSVNATGSQANGSSDEPSMSADGRFIAFSSDGSNLVAGDTNARTDVFVYDSATRRTTRVSLSPSGAEGKGISFTPSISDDGRSVAFSSTSALISGATTSAACECQAPDVYVRDRVKNTTIRVSVASDGAQASFAALPACSVDGRPALPVTLPELVELLLPGQQNFCGSSSSPRSMSHDGRYITFESNATNLVPNDTNYRSPLDTGRDIFVHDLRTHRTDRVSVSSVGHEGPGYNGNARISGDGGHIAFSQQMQHACGGTGLPVVTPPALSGVLGCGLDAYSYDRASGTLENLVRSYNGAPVNFASCDPLQRTVGAALPESQSIAINGDGRYSLVRSTASNLVAHDTNGLCDYFVRDRGAALGTGQVMQAGNGSASPPDQTCVGPVCIPPTPALSPTVMAGARVVTRPASDDLFLRWDLARLGAVNGAPAGGVLYEFRFSTGGQRFVVRVQRVASHDYDAAGGASFGLFRQTTAGPLTKVAALNGGYGTVGDAIVTAVPLSLLGGKAELTDVAAYTAVGSYLSGPTKVLDSIKLTRLASSGR